MTQFTIALSDSRGNVVAEGSVSKTGELVSGTIDLASMPAEIRRVFCDFEEIVNSQQFSCLDDIQSQIESLHLQITGADGTPLASKDLQIFPRTSRISFKLAKDASVNGSPIRSGERIGR